MRRSTAQCAMALTTLVALAASAQTLYKYRGENGEWIYTDRRPGNTDDVAETRDLNSGTVTGTVSIDTQPNGRRIDFIAHNRFHAPVELRIDFVTISGLDFPNPEDDRTWVLPARSETTVLSLALNGAVSAPKAEYRYEYSAGDPEATHAPTELYRVPYSVASEHTVTQAYPDVSTHRTPDSYYAVDIAMPIGTDIVAARSGMVFDVAENNFTSGLDPVRDGPAANVVRVLHDDGTYAIYAHLNWNSIRVRPGERVQRGQYIADSGNTGFSSGPHLHFAVVHNSRNGVASVPVQFEGANYSAVMPSTGMLLTAY